MMRAFFSLLANVWYLITGRTNEFNRRTLMNNPTVIQEKYDVVVREKVSRLNELKNVIARKISRVETKKVEHQNLIKDISKYSSMKNAAAAAARKLVLKYNNDQEAIKNDKEYMKCAAAFKDFSSTLKEKETRAEEIEDVINVDDQDIERLTLELTSINRDIDNLRKEKLDAAADIISAREQREIDDMVSGISQDKSAETLSELRAARTDAKAEAKLSAKLAGTDARQQEREFLAYANSETANAEFDELIGLSTPEQQPEMAEAKLPE